MKSVIRIEEFSSINAKKESGFMKLLFIILQVYRIII